MLISAGSLIERTRAGDVDLEIDREAQRGEGDLVFIFARVLLLGGEELRRTVAAPLRGGEGDE